MLLVGVASLALLQALGLIHLSSETLMALGVLGSTAADPIDEIRTGVKKLGEGMSKNDKSITDLDAALKQVQEDNKEREKRLKQAEDEAKKQAAEFDKLRKQFLQRGGIGGTVRRPGMVTDQCARYLAAWMIAGHARTGALDVLDANVREKMFDEARSILGMEVKAALTTTDIPLPSEFFSEIRELISEFGIARRYLMRFPIGRGTARPPRFKTRPAFGSIAMSAAFSEKSPQIDFASLESHKVGGIVRIPRELDEQSIVPMGQFMARYGAIEFARAEDTWAFLADGSGTYESVKGITKIALDNSKNQQPAGAAPSEMVVADFRKLRSFVNAAALSQGAAYFMNSTMEVHLRTLNTAADPYFFVHNNTVNLELNRTQATLDGFPIIWTDVFAAYSTTDQVSKFVAVFGVPQYWWFGEHGNPRLDFSGDVYFTTDEIGARFIEEIDFDYQALDAFGSLQLAAS
jgi:HK97 family phage major capsid protein